MIVGSGGLVGFCGRAHLCSVQLKTQEKLFLDSSVDAVIKIGIQRWNIQRIYGWSERNRETKKMEYTAKCKCFGSLVSFVRLCKDCVKDGEREIQRKIYNGHK